MKKFLFLTFFTALVLPNVLFAQNNPPVCPVPNPPPATSCANTCIQCTFLGYTGNNSTGLSGQNQTWCGSIQVSNPIYFGIVSASSHLTFILTMQNCMIGDGLQMVLFEDCQNDPIACNAGYGGSGSNGSVLELISPTVPGQAYILMIDGFLGDVCDFELIVDGVGQPPVLGNTGPISGPSKVCPGATVEYCIEPVVNATYYTWTLPGGFINGQASPVTLPASEGLCVNATFSNTGSFQLSAKAGSACSTSSNTSTKVIQSTPSITTVLPTITYPYDALPLECPINPGITYIAPGTYQCSTTLSSSLGCDSIIFQPIIIQNPVNSSAYGLVYWDNNQNGVRDSGEPVYGGGAIVFTSGGVFATTIANGQYSLSDLQTGDILQLQLPAGITSVLPTEWVFQPSQPSNQYNFGVFQAPSPNFDLSVDAGFTSVFRPGFSNFLHLTCKNISNKSVQNVQLKVALPSWLNVESGNPSNYVVINDTLCWNLGFFSPNTVVQVELHVSTPVSTSLGTPVLISALLTPLAQDLNVINNLDQITASVVGSYDPNDKQADPAFVTPAMLNNGLPVEYTIRFQNTGTFPADFVKILDTLSNTLDPGSFQFISSSHPCSWKVFGQGVIEFFFNNIFLPDSSSNEPESHGFVRFSIRPKASLSLGTVVKNTCDIYFDYNQPIRTNTAGTQVVYFIPGEGITTEDGLRLKPNPAAFHVFCSWKRPTPEAGTLSLYNMNGLLQLQQNVPAESVHEAISLNNVPAGQYFVVLQAGTVFLAKKLIVAQANPLGNGN